MSLNHFKLMLLQHSSLCFCLLLYFNNFNDVFRLLDVKYRPTVARVIFQPPLYKRIVFVDFLRGNLLIFESPIFLGYSLQNPVKETKKLYYITYLLVFAKYRSSCVGKYEKFIRIFLGFWTFSIVCYCREYNVSEAGSVSVLK
jgi:hypothetical protein